MAATHQLHSAKIAGCSLPPSARMELVSLLLATLSAENQTAAVNAAATVDLDGGSRMVRNAIARGNRGVVGAP